MIATLAAVLDTLGLVAFAVTGALVASRKQMDITGFALLAIVTGIGGGTLRDLLLGIAPVNWIASPRPLLLCTVVGCVTFFVAHVPRSRLVVVLWLDAVGLAVFAAGGARTALEAGASPLAAVVMGVVTATFGGIIRDVLGAESPVILQREIYVTAALAGALVLVALAAVGLSRDVADIAGFAVAFTLRGLALRRDWSLPRYRPHGPRELEPDAGAAAPPPAGRGRARRSGPGSDDEDGDGEPGGNGKPGGNGGSSDEVGDGEPGGNGKPGGSGGDGAGDDDGAGGARA